jgi:hypothetical protein
MFFLAVASDKDATSAIIEHRKEITLAAISFMSAMFSAIYIFAKRDKLSLENKKRKIENDILEEELKVKKLATRIKELELENIQKEKAPRN